MNKIVADLELVSELSQQDDIAAICDSTGRLVGYFTPALSPADYEGVDAPATEEELDRRSREGGGRTLAEIMADLVRRQ